MLKPTIHLNGTSAESLLEQYQDACSALHAAIKAVSEASPNARDYYVQGPTAFAQAAHDQEGRIAKLYEVLRDMEDLAIHCSDHVR